MKTKRIMLAAAAAAACGCTGADKAPEKPNIIYLMFEPTILKIAGEDGVYPLPVCPITVIGDILFFICVIMTVISGMDYLLKNLDYLKNSD